MIGFTVFIGHCDPVPSQDGKVPKVMIVESTHDLGNIKKGTPIAYAFKVKNTGDADLIIEKVSPG